MNIIYFNNLYKPFGGGGAELLVSHLAEEMVSRGHQVTVITTCPPDYLNNVEGDVINGVRVIRFFPKNLFWVHDDKVRTSIEKIIWHTQDAWNSSAANKCCQLLSSIKPDVVHTHNIDGFSPSIWNEVTKAGIPLIHTAHDCHQLCVKSTLLRSSGEICIRAPLVCQLYRSWYKRQSSMVDVFCTPSEFTKQLYRLNNFQPKKFQVVRNGIPHLGSLKNSMVTDEKSKKGVKFLFMGRLETAKGIQTVLDSFNRLPKDSDVVLNIAGIGNLESEVLQAAEQDSRIRYHGYVKGDKKLKLFEDSDVFIFSSIGYETFGMGVIEAYSLGLPVIATELSALPEIVSEGVTGFLYLPGDSIDLFDKMMRFISDPEMISTMKIEAVKLFEQFTVARMADDYHDIYASMGRL